MRTSEALGRRLRLLRKEEEATPGTNKILCY
jgi:hypothetical protein